MEACRTFVEGNRAVVGENNFFTVHLFLYSDGGRGGTPVTILSFAGEGTAKRYRDLCKGLGRLAHTVLKFSLITPSTLASTSTVCWRSKRNRVRFATRRAVRRLVPSIFSSWPFLSLTPFHHTTRQIPTKDPQIILNTSLSAEDHDLLHHIHHCHASVFFLTFL